LFVILHGMAPEDGGVRRKAMIIDAFCRKEQVQAAGDRWALPIWHGGIYLHLPAPYID